MGTRRLAIIVPLLTQVVLVSSYNAAATATTQTILALCLFASCNRKGSIGGCVEAVETLRPAHELILNLTMTTTAREGDDEEGESLSSSSSASSTVVDLALSSYHNGVAAVAAIAMEYDIFLYYERRDNSTENNNGWPLLPDQRIDLSTFCTNNNNDTTSTAAAAPFSVAAVAVAKDTVAVALASTSSTLQAAQVKALIFIKDPVNNSWKEVPEVQFTFRGEQTATSFRSDDKSRALASVAISQEADTILLGSPRHAKVFVFERRGTDNPTEAGGAAAASWNEQYTQILESRTKTPKGFGYSVALSTANEIEPVTDVSIIIVGAPASSTSKKKQRNKKSGAKKKKKQNRALENEIGAAYVFVRSAGQTLWLERFVLEPPIYAGLDSATNFGVSVAVAHDTVVVGSPGRTIVDRGDGQKSSNILYGGLACTFILKRGVTGWRSFSSSLEKRSSSSSSSLFDTIPMIVKDSRGDDGLGHRVAITASDDLQMIAVGAPHGGDTPTSGAGYLYVRDLTNKKWSNFMSYRLFANDPVPKTYLGSSIAVNGNTALVAGTGGVFHRQQQQQSQAGSIVTTSYVFETPANCVPKYKLCTSSRDCCGDRVCWFSPKNNVFQCALRCMKKGKTCGKSYRPCCEGLRCSNKKDRGVCVGE